MARSSKGPGSRGTGKASGGLVARRKWFADNAAKSGGRMPDGNGQVKMQFHNPGSQNPRKGGPGKE